MAKRDGTVRPAALFTEMHPVSPCVKPRESDGGHHAIKGFAYQFDASLLETFRHPRSVVQVEGKQDLSIDEYHMQIKNRSSKFALSELSTAIHLMVHQFMEDPKSRFRLHCHFSDRAPGEIFALSIDDLDSTLALFSCIASDEVRQNFIKACEIAFAENYEEQFTQLLQLIKRELGAQDISEAVSYHAILHGHVRDAILSNAPGSRVISQRSLKQAISTAKRSIFQSGYAEYCGYEKYLKAVRKNYNFKSVNVLPRERIFSFECDSFTNPEDIAEAALLLRNRYHVPPNSPAPYLTFRGDFDLTSIKSAMWDVRALFDDGTGYNGGSFRIDDLVDPPSRSFGLKIVEAETIPLLLKRVSLKEFHDFYTFESVEAPFSASKSSHVFLQSYADLSRIL
ncbi:hypothetical protein [Streptomyces hygroscopicus]|uniref:hypothetical protein n=1 Tax=Streptomyces hygroscopicus TaxID=1912 RepID=UPI00117C8229|nr:hypothetical protein [Streptomyces hygroscopicus]